MYTVTPKICTNMDNCKYNMYMCTDITIHHTVYTHSIPDNNIKMRILHIYTAHIRTYVHTYIRITIHCAVHTVQCMHSDWTNLIDLQAWVRRYDCPGREVNPLPWEVPPEPTLLPLQPLDKPSSWLLGLTDRRESVQRQTSLHMYVR